MSVTSGPTLGKQFAYYDPNTRSWKMWPATGLWGSVEFSETWPKSGTMRDGRAYERPMLAHRTTGSGFSLSQLRVLPTPVASDLKQSDSVSARGRKSPPLPAVTAHFLPTPNARDGVGGGAQMVEVRKAGGHQVNLTDWAFTVARLYPTPKASDGMMGRPRTSGRPEHKSTHLGTVTTIKGVEGYGPYAPAVHRWEQVRGVPAPAPTQPNRKGNPQLNPAFAEWMMGLPPGHVTALEIGLSRAEQLKMIGNGVCPQQALAALQHMIGEKE